MNEIKSFLKKLKAYDLVVIAFYIFLTILHLIFFDKILNSSGWIVINAGIVSLAFLLAFLEDRYTNRVWRILHYWYIAPLILLTFKELYYMIKPIRGMDYDFLFINIDRFLFGGDPTKFFYHIANPLLTEILQIVYGSFYLLPIILCLSLLRKKRYVATDFALFSVVYGFFLSYLGYFLLPGIGPRFTLHDFNSVNQALPGLYLTNFLREVVNAGESIPAGTINPADLVQRDVFPSGHTMITLIVMYLSIKLKSRSRYFFIPVGSLLIFSTVYLWYHYVIDLIAGALFMMFAMWSGKYIFNWWRRKIHKEGFEYLKH
ncbi:MAG: phosphatase PAP2 family protein [Ignavibacteriales bacterium]|nr:phosphatase PAP2 family protein [Ignavibacteriales bacterium]